MACYLRVYGDELNVRELIATLDIKPSKVFEKGLPRFKSNPKKLNKFSGLNIEISNAEWNEFEKQKEVAIEWRNEAVQCDSFPPILIKLAGQIGLGIELSQYPPDDEDE